MTAIREQIAIFWFRRDLRLDDNTGLHNALKSGYPVLPVFVFDTQILDQLENKQDRRVEFICEALTEIHKQLLSIGSGLKVFFGRPKEMFAELVEEYSVRAVFANHDYEPYAIGRDNEIEQFLHANGISFQTFKDQVIFEKDEVIKDNGSPYTVFTPYCKKWRSRNPGLVFPSFDTAKFFNTFHKQSAPEMPSLESIGFKSTGQPFPAKIVRDELISSYATQRDYPALPGTSRLGVHLRFGTISIRQLATTAAALNSTFLNELIWREFYQMILWHFPRVGAGRAFKPAYEHIKWRNNEDEFSHWCEGKTGYPIVDAGMRELNATGYMHNRVRMIVASFLTKHLLIDWRWGEAYFAEKLLDFDLGSNNGGWQWAAGSGCDAAPYFRVFNPALQTAKFDASHAYIRKWVPEYEEFGYPEPIVNHEFARQRCLDAYKSALTAAN